MNYFTQLSIELANQRDYLDQLYSVYHFAPENLREIDKSVWNSIELNFNAGNNLELFKELLKLDLFPIKDGYVPFFRKDKTAVERNPRTVDRICGRIYQIGLDKLYERCAQPKETNRQMGPLFRKWVESGVLGVKPVDKATFMRTKRNAILGGTDSELKEFAKEHLGYCRNKGLDFLGRFNGKYVIGEAKFISDDGGHQNDQFEDAMLTVKTAVKPNVLAIGILDGVLYIHSQSKIYKQITTEDLPIMSALFLREFLHTL